MHSIDPTTAAGTSNAADLLVAIPRSRWLTIRRVCIFSVNSVICLAAAFLILTDLVHHKGMPGILQALLVVLAGLLFVSVLFRVVLIWFSLKLPLEIFKSGIAFQGLKMPWEAVEWCRWARYSPEVLEVQLHRVRDHLLIPRAHRAAVEAALRDVGKWQC
jgi:hypothetical protein